MRCPYCSSDDSTRVVDSRLTEPGDAIRRRRECESCGERFTTYERAEEAPVTVVKRDGSTERFDRQKLVRGLTRSVGGRPVSTEQIEALADAIAAEVRSGGASVEASLIGELCLRGLAGIDPVSAILFASVYRRFADLAELQAEVRRLIDEPVPGADQLPLGSDPVPSDPHPNIGRSTASVRTDRREHVRQP